MQTGPEGHLVPSWLAAARDPAISAALEEVYALISAEIASRAPVCWSSGRCCNFEQAGHRLYATGLETAYCLVRLPPGLNATLAGIAEARTRGGCPFQSSNLCGVHSIKPVGCRIYFCDRSAQDWQRDLSERTLERVRALHDLHRIDYRYAEWRSLLESIVPFLPASAPLIGPQPDSPQGIALPVLRPRDAS